MNARSSHGLNLLAGTALLLSGCATLINSDHQSVRIFSEPGEAKVVVDDRFHFRQVARRQATENEAGSLFQQPLP